MFHCSNWTFTGLVRIICVQYSRPSIIQICVQKTEFLSSGETLLWNIHFVFTIRTLIEQPLLILNKQQARVWIMEGPMYSGALQLPSKYLATSCYNFVHFCWIQMPQTSLQYPFCCVFLMYSEVEQSNRFKLTWHVSVLWDSRVLKEYLDIHLEIYQISKITIHLSLIRM